jgi:hypothetical protein
MLRGLALALAAAALSSAEPAALEVDVPLAGERLEIGQTTRYELHGLQPGAHYEVRVSYPAVVRCAPASAACPPAPAAPMFSRSQTQWCVAHRPAPGGCCGWSHWMGSVRSAPSLVSVAYCSRATLDTQSHTPSPVPVPVRPLTACARRRAHYPLQQGSCAGCSMRRR